MRHSLLLNTGYEPLRIISWQRAFVLVFQQKVEILEEYEEQVRSVSQEFCVPAVVKLRRWVNLKKISPIIRFSRNNVYARDEFRCQYCYDVFSEKELTMDHVIPVVRGGRKTWENIVAACRACNQKKRDRSPQAAGLTLLRAPKAPRWLPGMMGPAKTKKHPDLWEPYLAMGLQNLRSFF